MAKKIAGGNAWWEKCLVGEMSDGDAFCPKFVPSFLTADASLADLGSDYDDYYDNDDDYGFDNIHKDDDDDGDGGEKDN